jgi:hypothetical protein
MQSAEVYFHLLLLALTVRTIVHVTAFGASRRLSSPTCRCGRRESSWREQPQRRCRHDRHHSRHGHRHDRLRRRQNVPPAAVVCMSFIMT